MLAEEPGEDSGCGSVGGKQANCEGRVNLVDMAIELPKFHI